MVMGVFFNHGGTECTEKKRREEILFLERKRRNFFLFSKIRILSSLRFSAVLCVSAVMSTVY